MINSTRCAILAKQACATFSQVVQKITPPIANNFLKFFFVLFATLALGVGNAWGEEATITFANKGLTNGTQYLEPFEIDANTTITFAGGGNDGKYYNTGSGMRTYGDGTITIACTNGTISEISFTWGGDSYKPTSDVANPVGYSKTTSKWTGSASSVTLTRPSGSGHWRLQKVTVTYETSGGETPGEGGNDPEEPGTDDDCVWQLVTSASNLKVGDEIVIAAKDYNYALSTTQNNNNRGKANITKNQDQTITFGDDVQIITLEEGVSYSGTYVFYAGTGYLYAAGANSNNYLKTSNQKIANGDWEIEITNGTAIVTAQGSASRNILKYNNNSGIFSCYASDNSMQDIVLYKKVCAVAQTYSVKKGTLENCKLKFSKTEDNFTNDELTGLVEKDYVYFTITPSSGYELKGEPVVKDASDNNVECVEEDGVWMFEMPVSDVTVSVSCVLTVKTYKVTFNANGHGTAPTAQNVEENKKATEPTAPSATGYTFGGWYTDQACSDDKKFDFNTPITKDITLYAKWTANTYKITFNAGTGICGTESATATYADGITLPTATPSDVCDEVGWTFAGWATSSVAETTSAPTLLKANDKYQPTSSITLYAVYSQTETNLGGGENSATLTFDNTSKRTEFTTEKQVWTENGITLTNIKGTQQGAADVGDYSNPARLYKGSTTLVETSNEILKIVFTCSSSAYANVLANTIGNTAESSESIVTVASVGANSYAIPALGDQVRLKSITVTYTASGTSTTTYNSNPNCTPPSEYTITWWANGEEYYTQTAVEGIAIDVPTNSPNAATYACDDKVFVGWVGAEIIGSIDTKPTLITEFGEIEGDKAFFAVFATEQSSSTTTLVYKLVTNISGGKEYIFATGNSAGSVNGLTCDANSNLTATSLAVKVSDGLTYIETPASNNVVWNITGSSSSYQAQNKGQSGKYLRCYGTAPNAVIDETARALYWDTSKGLYGKSNSGSTSYYLYYDASSSKWGAKSSPSGRVYAFEKSEITFDNTTYSGYVTTCEASTETLSGKFSTGKYEYAEFATGNLQYKPSTDSWRFAKQQYQYVGKDNIYVGKEDYKGWIDLFGWSADDKFGVNPSNDNANYQGEFVDWGKLFPEEGWSTLSKNQWYYLLNQRTNAASLKQIAMVGETLGIMLFPDEWTLPAGCAPTQQTHHDEEDGEDHSCDFVSYNYTLAHWTELEKAGAIFLPAAGRRTGGWGNETISPHMIGKAELDADRHYKHYADYYAYYWTSTKTDGKVNYLINCTLVDKVKDTYTVHTGHVYWAEEARYGQSVRLAKVTSTLIQLGDNDNSEVIEANAGKTVNVQVNRTFANDGYYYTLCLPFDLDAKKIGKALQISSVTENVAEQGMNVVFTEAETLLAGQPYLVLPSENLTNPIFEGVKIVDTEGETTETVSGAGINITFTGIINGVGEQTNGTTHYYVGNKGCLYNEPTAKLGLRAFFTITDAAGQEVKNIRARVVVGENTTTGVDNSQLPITNIQKVIENGQLIIIRNGEKFNAQGQKL